MSLACILIYFWIVEILSIEFIKIKIFYDADPALKIILVEFQNWKNNLCSIQYFRSIRNNGFLFGFLFCSDYFSLIAYKYGVNFLSFQLSAWLQMKFSGIIRRGYSSKCRRLTFCYPHPPSYPQSFEIYFKLVVPVCLALVCKSKL